MNNMQKSFKQKAKLGLRAAVPGYADGGIIRPTPGMLGSGLAAGAGAALQGRGAQLDGAIAADVDGAPPPAAPAYVAPSAGAAGLSNIRDGATPPAGLLAAQRRGLRDGGPIVGPGGPTEDKVPIMASPGEFMLPADTVAKVGAGKLHSLVAATHTPVVSRPAHFANGGEVDPSLLSRAGNAAKAGFNAVSDGLRSGANWARGTAANVLSSAPKVDPTAMSDGISNAERVAATPPGYVTGGLAQPASKALSFAKGAATKVAAPLAVAGAITDSAAPDSTDRYARRFGVSPPTGDGSVGDIAKFVGLRAGGFASDLGNKLTLGAAGNFYRDKPAGTLQFSAPASAAPATPAPAPAAAPAASAAPAVALTPDQQAAQADDAAASQWLTNNGVSAADQASAPMSFRAAQASSTAAGLGAGKNYKLGGGQYDDSNAPIFAASTSPTGKLNSFTGIGNGNRPNWEQRNPADYQAAVARAAADKAKLADIESGAASQREKLQAAVDNAGSPTAVANARQNLAAFEQTQRDQMEIKSREDVAKQGLAASANYRAAEMDRNNRLDAQAKKVADTNAAREQTAQDQAQQVRGNKAVDDMLTTMFDKDPAAKADGAAKVREELAARRADAAALGTPEGNELVARIDRLGLGALGADDLAQIQSQLWLRNRGKTTAGMGIAPGSTEFHDSRLGAFGQAKRDGNTLVLNNGTRMPVSQAFSTNPANTWLPDFNSSNPSTDYGAAALATPKPASLKNGRRN